MGARGDFYDYRDKDGVGRVYEVHRRSIHPAMRVCKEWGSLLLNEDVKVVCDNQGATDWINGFFSSTSFMNAAQATADEGRTHVMFDDSIIQDVAAEKDQDMREAGVTLDAWEYRMKWLGEDEQTARRYAAEIGVTSEHAGLK